MSGARPVFDRARSAARIARDVAVLSSPPYSGTRGSVTRHAFDDAYERTISYLADAFTGTGFAVHRDPVGTLVASNVPAGAPAHGVGSHCDSVPDGGAWDGTLGVLCALELCRLTVEHGERLPLRAFAFVEEEGAGFGQVLLGSRVMTGSMTGDDLRSARRAADGTSFWDAARAAGLDPGQWRRSAEELAGLYGFLEIHIEQGPRLQEAGRPVAVVDAIAGLVQGDLVFTGRAGHAGGSPMDHRRDALVPAARVIAAAADLARAHGVVATVGEVDVYPGAANVVPGRVRLSVDVRSPGTAHLDALEHLLSTARDEAAGGRCEVTWTERVRRPATPLDAPLRARLQDAVRACATDGPALTSWAAHDSMCLATRVPTAMLFVPCVDGVSHAPEEQADPADAAVAVEVAWAALRARAG